MMTSLAVLLLFVELSLSLDTTIVKQQVYCRGKVKLPDDWWVCLTPNDTAITVLSAGLSHSLEPEVALAQHERVRVVHTFDPTQEAAHAGLLRFNRLPPRLQYHSDCVLGKVDGRLSLFKYRALAGYTLEPHEHERPRATETFESRRLSTLLAQLKLSSIDVLKLDVEGSEWAILDDIAVPPLQFRQLLVDFHVHASHTRAHRPAHSLQEMFTRLNRLRLKAFYVGDERPMGNNGYIRRIGFVSSKATPLLPPPPPPRPPPPPPHRLHVDFSELRAALPPRRPPTPRPWQAPPPTPEPPPPPPPSNRTRIQRLQALDADESFIARSGLH